jgi:hypothetical protein
LTTNDISIKIRDAIKTDKQEVLEFCTDTFQWGDYIHEVWDDWYSDRNGVLLVGEITSEYNDDNHNKTKQGNDSVNDINTTENESVTF